MKTVEQDLRDILEQMKIPGALDFSSGELVFLAEYVSDATKRGINVGLERAAKAVVDYDREDPAVSGRKIMADAILELKVKE